MQIFQKKQQNFIGLSIRLSAYADAIIYNIYLPQDIPLP